MQSKICGQSSGSRNCRAREVDGEHQIRGRHLPAGKLGTAELQHQLAELADEPQLLRQRDELVGEIMPNSGMGPTAEQLSPHVQPVAVGTDDGLVDGGQLGGLDGEAATGRR